MHKIWCSFLRKNPDERASEVLSELYDRDGEIIRFITGIANYPVFTLKEIANVFERSETLILHLRNRGLRMLSQPRRSERLVEFLEAPGVPQRPKLVTFPARQSTIDTGPARKDCPGRATGSPRPTYRVERWKRPCSPSPALPARPV